MTSRATLHLDSRALKNNFKYILTQQPWAKIIPMVKANAYGHGAEWVTEQLKEEEQIYAFGVATCDEALVLRKKVKKLGRLIVFSDTAPWTEEKESFFVQHRLEPVFTDFQSYLLFQSRKRKRKLPFHLEFNTGMNRLGFDPEFLRYVSLVPESVFSHLADGENPKSTLTQQQLNRMEGLFEHAQKKFGSFTQLHFQNSAGIFFLSNHSLAKRCLLMRPGLSLYGIHPHEKAQNKSPLKLIMSVYAPVLQVQHLSRGERVGYGGGYEVSATHEVIATIGAGYADGVFRAAANQGQVLIKKGPRTFLSNIVGRVSMDLTTIRIPKGVSIQVGDQVQLWGKGLLPHAVAHQAGTIPYEWTTRIGSRVARYFTSDSKRR